MTTRPIVAVVPFGARGSSPKSGAWARQIARRLVDRFAAETALEVRPVFLVAMPEESSEAGYLVFGSSPDTDLAAQYATSLGATHALTAVYREDGGARALRLDLVDAARKHAESLDLRIAEDGLHRAEPQVARWLVDTLGVTPSVDVATPATANENAYAALLEGMDEEVNATLLRTSDPQRADASIEASLRRYVDAARADPASTAPEERVLVLGAESLERGDARAAIAALEELVTIRPRSWRTNYMLGQLRAE
ncbi:MAG TPA: hypothetical protein VM052_00705, partial [Candidatus Limnocylindrales bacterium]|nr:hypothetical protein [Candidatus Limnocylindrales bacterium]